MQWTIVGLGNPGAEYAHTRHNVGQDIVRVFGKQNTAVFSEKKIHAAQHAHILQDDKDLLLVLPTTYMNESGRALRKLIKNPESAAQLIVVHDDIDLPIGEWKIAWARGAGGHNGLKSIMETLKTRSFLRVRVGIAPVIDGITTKPKGEKRVVDFVLGKFSPTERQILEKVTKDIVTAISDIIMHGKAQAMNVWNTRSS